MWHVCITLYSPIWCRAWCKKEKMGRQL